MSLPPQPDDELSDIPPAEEQRDEEEQGSTAEDQTTNQEIGSVAEEDTNVYATSAEERIKSVKAGLGLIVAHDNNAKIREGKDGVKVEVDKNGSEEEDGVPPALPPRPPPRPRQPCNCTCVLDDGNILERNDGRVPRYCWANGLRKYVFLCTVCGSLSILLGALFLIVYFMLKSYTSSLNHFETIPTYVPSGMLIATGFLIICLACRKNRNSFLMKLCGLCSLCCAVLCVSVTVTTTVIHMNRLQTLRECLYTLKTQSCTCYSVIVDNDRISDEGIKFVFNSTPDCEVIHGALYSCLRAIFGLSVIGILVCIFSCMLVYQLLSHEKKKMYWAQLEMRCRYLYRQQRNPHYYSCCDECRYPPHPHELFPWDLMGNRFWSTGRIGNLYTPNPEDRGNVSRLRSGWNWRRLPWSRTGTNSNEPTRANLGSPDSQYGFSSTPTVDGMPYTVLDPRTPGGISACHTGIPAAADITEGGFYSWGPPPPYASNRNSANNSPARRSLGDILHQVSPIRRNDNVSPARAVHHVHRHHLHHNRQCGSSSRQVPSGVQNSSESFQKATPLRPAPITNAIQQQQTGMDTLWSNSLSSVHRFHKVLQNKANYENMYDSNSILPTDGFNTLPSLKRRTQPRVGDIFQNDTSTAYFFSSAENLAYSNGNIKIDSPNENLPPRVFLKTSHPNSSRYVPPNVGSTTHNFSFKTHTDVIVSDSPNQHPSEGADAGDGRLRNASLVRKLLVNCSPSKQKPRQNPQSFEKGDQTPRKKTNRKLEPKDVGAEEKVIMFHYRVGIPRSPDVQNFTQFLDKSPSKGGPEGSSNDPPKDSDPQPESQKLSKSTKYIPKDVDLLQKHGSLIKEFRKNLDSQKKYRNTRTENENEPGKEKQNFPKRRSPGVALEVRQHFPTNDATSNEDYLPALQKPNENESDVYFGDISNSSCYMSLQNDCLESLVYEDSTEGRLPIPSFSSSGHHVLNKQNLKIMESETSPYDQIIQKHDDSLYSRHLHQNYRHRTKFANQFLPPEQTSAEFTPLEPPTQDSFHKNPRRPYNNPHFNDLLDGKPKYFAHGIHPYHQQESNDEQSSGSLTADSGISTGRSFIATCFDSAYHEVEPKPAEVPPSDDPPLGGKISALDFSHPLFQKPKVLPRGSRYKDADSRQKKKFDLEESESGNDGDLDCQSKRKRNSAGKASEEMPNQTPSTCSINLTRDSHHFLEGGQFEGLPQGGEGNPPLQDETFPARSSPKPLPRTSVPNKNSGESPGEHFGKGCRYLQSKDKLEHYIAPDAQYEFQEALKGEAKLKTPVKGKPAVPARPLSLQVEHKKTGKADNVSLRVMRSSGEGSRRQNVVEDVGGGGESGETSSHSVNV